MPTPTDPDLTAPPPGDLDADFAPPAPATTTPAAAVADDPYLKDSQEAKTFFDRAVAEADGGDEADAVVHFLRASKLAEAAREWYLTALASHRVADIFYTPQPPFDLERALRMYERAAAAYESCGHFDEARRLGYRVATIKLWRGRELGLSWWLRVELFVFWAAAGFGYRPQRVVATAAGVVLAFAVLFWSLGGVRTPDGRPVGDFGDAVYFSGVTFLTIGYGDLLPAPHVRPLALTEGAIGMFVMSFFVVVLANRLRH